MNTFLNYLIEANIGLIFFYAIYWIVLQKEDQFTFKRTYLLASVIASLMFPFFTIGTSTSLIPSLSQTTAVQWLPEIVIYANGNAQPVVNSFQFNWSWITIAYLIIAACLFTLFLIRILSLITLFKRSTHYAWKNYTVAESDKVQGVFSFFNFIFLSPGELLAEAEKQEILRHEEVHIKKLHSLDIILMQLLGIVFWFNPIIRSYKKSFVQVHEFEADARSVEGHDVDEYCSLLAKVALQNNGYVLANHFTNSFTLKRIMMMKTVKRKIKNWKVVAAAFTLPLFFFVVACQDQVVEDMNLVAKNSTMSLELPKEVQKELDWSKANYPPGTEFYVLEMNEEGKQKMQQLTKEMNTRGLEGRMITVNDENEERNFFIYKKDGQTNKINDLTVSEDGVFSVVEESAEPMGGMTEFYKVIASEIKYPAEARAKGIEGRVFVEFIVDTDGSVYGAHVLKGIGAGCDEEAARVVALSPAWIPGKQSGQIVKQRMVIPIIFKLDGSGKIIEPDQNTNSTLGELSVTAYPKKN